MEKAVVLAVLPNRSLIVGLSVPLSVAGPPELNLLLGSLSAVIVSFTVEPLTVVFAVALADAPVALMYFALTLLSPVLQAVLPLIPLIATVVEPLVGRL